MDLIQSYHDQGSQSSSSGDETRFLCKHATAPSTSSFSNEITMPKMVSTFEPIERIPIDRLMIATAAIAQSNQKQKQKQHAATGIAQWISDVDKEIRMCLGSIQTLQKYKILESMDHFISKLTKDYEKMSKPSTADSLAHYIRTYLHICRYLFRSLEKGKRYYKRFIRLLSIYTDLELCASLRGIEYDKTIAERICLVYQTYLDHLDNSMVLDVWLNTKRLWRQHRSILGLLFEYFLVRKTTVELPDTLYMKNLFMFKKWLYIEDLDEERIKAQNAFEKFIKPMKSICMNSLFKPYLPVDKEGFVTIDNASDILNKEYSLKLLSRCLKKADQRSEMNQQNEEVIVLTDDDENEQEEDDSFSNHGASSSATFSQYDDISNDFDWYSTSSQQGNQTSFGPALIETVSLDSPPPPPSKRKTSSMSSLDSCDLNVDTRNALSINSDKENRIELPSTSSAKEQDVNGDENRNLSTLDESIFVRLVNDINSTQVSLPSNGNTSADSKIIGNGESSEMFEVENNSEVHQAEDVRSAKSDKTETQPINGIVPHVSEAVSSLSNGNSSLAPLICGINLELIRSSTMQHNHIVKSIGDTETICDKAISNDSLLRNHKEATNIDDSKNYTETLPGTSNQIKTITSRIEATSNPILNAEMPNREQSNKEPENMEIVQEGNLPTDFVPAAESTVSVINETSLLSKSEQDVLFKDRDAALIFNDLWSNGPTAVSPKPDENRSLRLSPDSPLPFLAKGIDPSFRLKTYARHQPRRFVETKTISTQTSVSPCPSPVTTIEENKSNKKDRYLLTGKEDDESFLRDIFNIPEVPTRSSNGSPRIQSPILSSSTPSVSTLITSTSKFTPNVSEDVQTTVNSSDMGSTIVKRKRGRPRKNPLPEPGITPVAKPKSPRQPRQPKPQKDQNETDDQPIVFEKRVLRERKPKPIPQPEPVQKPRKKREVKKKEIKKNEVQKEEVSMKEITPKQKRERRRNTIKMAFDAIMNTQSLQIRAIQARRISQILGIPVNSQQIATILKRYSYNKSTDRSLNSDDSFNVSSMLQMNHENGQMNSTNIEMSSQHNNTTTSSTILARKTYINPNKTIASFSSALRRISFQARRMSRLSFSASKRPNKRTTNPRKPHTQQQRYTQIDIFDTSKKRGRKKGTKDSAPRKKYTRKNKTEQKIITETSTNKKQIVEIDEKVNEETVEIVDLTNNQSEEFAHLDLDTTNEMHNQFANIHTALSSTQYMHSGNSVVTPLTMASKRRNFLTSDETETDFTNEFTTDPEDTDDSCTRKSTRFRKRPKILDL